MKRDKMLEIIQDALSGYFGGSDKLTLDDKSDAAKEVLEAIEKAGMLPPKTNFGTFRGNLNEWED